MQGTLQNVALPARLRPSVPLSDDELMAFSQANKPCRVERLASGEILVMTPSGYKNNRREAHVVHELFGARAVCLGRGGWARGSLQFQRRLQSARRLHA
ncbi:MAG: hypothetical protein ABR956_13265 [Terracidiphilus sp.]